MSDAIRELRNYLAKSPSVVYPEDVLAYLSAIEDENTKLREERDHWHVEQIHAYGNWEDAYRRAVELDAENAKLRKQAARAWRLFLKHGAVHSCDLPEVDAVRDGLRELGVEVS